MSLCDAMFDPAASRLTRTLARAEKKWKARIMGAVGRLSARTERLTLRSCEPKAEVVAAATTMGVSVLRLPTPPAATPALAVAVRPRLVGRLPLSMCELCAQVLPTQAMKCADLERYVVKL